MRSVCRYLTASFSESVWLPLCISSPVASLHVLSLLHHVLMSFSPPSSFFYYAHHQRPFEAAVYSRDGWERGMAREWGGGGDSRVLYSAHTHCLVNEAESRYCRLSSSGLDSAVPVLIDISSPPSRPGPPTAHSTFSLITKHRLARQWPRPGPDEHTLNARTYLCLARSSYSSRGLERRVGGPDSYRFCGKYSSPPNL